MIKLWTACVPVFIWISAISYLPHKEERFLYIVYPHICLSAALALTMISRLNNSKLLVNLRLKPFFNLFKRLLVCGYVILSLMRTCAIWINFRAPMEIYNHLPVLPVRVQEKTAVCLGDEWHRFPSSFFLPSKSYRLGFLKQGFLGLLPPDFSEEVMGTRSTKNRFNSENKQELSSYIEAEECDFLIDFESQSTESVFTEEMQKEDWIMLHQMEYLDRESVVSARATALSFGGTAAANSRAISDSQGFAKSTVVSIANENSRAIGEAFAESKDGVDASATLITRATGEIYSPSFLDSTFREDGATVDAKAGAIGEEKGAKAIVNSTASAKGDVVLESVAISEAINRGDGEIINRVLERAYADSEILGDKVSKGLTKHPHPNEQYSVEDFFVFSDQNDNYQSYFPKDRRSYLRLSQKGCSSLKTYLTSTTIKFPSIWTSPSCGIEVKDEASKQGTDDSIVSAMHEESVLAQCTYPTCAETEFCCAKSMADVHLCELCPMTDVCGYVAYGNGIYSILKSASPYTAAKLCACPN
eukprot:g1903.t1